MASTYFSPMLLLLSLFLSLISSPYVHASIDIDCGATVGSIDSNLKSWVGDGDYVSGGEIREIRGNYNQVMNTLRLFRAQRSCYNIREVTRGQPLLIRASFKYGNYDGRNSPPTFDLYLEGSRWDTVVPTSDVNAYTFSEAVYTPQKNGLAVCLVQTRQNNYPFISALEVIDLESTMYTEVARNRALAYRLRYDYGSTASIFGFPSDTYDRYWLATSDDSMTSVTSDTSIILNTPENQPPETVLSTAVIPSNESEPLILATSTGGNDVAYIYMYFTEMSELDSTQRRSFVVTVGGRAVSTPITPAYQRATELVLTNITANENDTLALVATSGSNLPPIISAIEIYRLFDVTPLSGSDAGGGGGGGGGGSGGGSGGRSGSGDGGSGDGGSSGGSSGDNGVDGGLSSTSSSKKSNLPVILGTVIPIAVIFWAVVGFCVFASKRRRAAIATMNGAGQGNPNGAEQGMTMGAMGKPQGMNNGNVAAHVNDPVQIQVNFDMGGASDSQQQQDENGGYNNQV